MTAKCYPTITASNGEIEQALENASIPTLMMSMIHMTGSTALLQGDIKPGQGVLGEVQGFMSEEDKASIRQQALEVIIDYRDRSTAHEQAKPTYSVPDDDTLYQMMCFIAGAELPMDSAAMMLEELSLDGVDRRAVALEKSIDANVISDHSSIIIGGGMSGILAAIRLKQAGMPFILLEKNTDKGGTWFENTYPGARVDIPADIYCYTFEPSEDWTQFYPKQHELKSYFDRCTDKYTLADHIRYDSEVSSMAWDEEQAQWQVNVRDRNGNEQSLIANSVISAVGQLNRPSIPSIKGIGQFNGPQFHSAAFEHQHELKGKKVAIVGTGASAFQLGPELAKVAGELTVYQRSPAWMFPNPGYHDDIDSATQWLNRFLPGYARWYRFLLFWISADALLPTLIKDPDWPHPDRAVNAINDMYRQNSTDWIESQVSDPVLLKQVLPDYPPFVKRILQDNGSWLKSLQQDNVRLVTDPIQSIDSNGINHLDSESDTVEHIDADVLIYATGFHCNKWLYPMEITGRNNVKLNDYWGDEPKAYLGITVPNFPNFYCMYGPNTNLAHAGTLFFNSECQIRYIIECMNAQLQNGAGAMEVKESVNTDYNARVQAEFAKTVWTHEGAGSWYKNRSGNITTNTPWRLADYWQWTLKPELEEYHLR